jgi:uncharacterized protein
MEPRVSFITLAVAERLVLSLWAESAFEAEVGPLRRGPGIAPITLAHNCRNREHVDAVLAAAGCAGAQTLPAEERGWGGYSGYFSDQDGYRWEVAWNPHPIGQLVLPEVDT